MPTARSIEQPTRAARRRRTLRRTLSAFATMTVFAAISLLVAGCSTFGALNYGLCDDPRTAAKQDGILRPITWSQRDTDATIAEVKAHNAVVKAECGR